MKKLISSALAIAMVASMATVSFAVDATTIKVDDNSKLYKENDGVLYEVDSSVGIAPGQKLYVEVLPEKDGEEITSKVAGQHKIVYDWYNGKEVFEKSQIENKKVSETTSQYTLIKGQTAPHALAVSYDTLQDLKDAIDGVRIHDPNCKLFGCFDPLHELELTSTEKTDALNKYAAQQSAKYKYVAAIYTKSSYSTKQTDLNGTIKVVKKTTSNSSAATSKNINSVVGYSIADIGGDMHEVENEQPVVNFDGIDGDVELLFGNTASFTVNAKSQNDLFLGYTVKPDGTVLDQNPEANIDFITFKANPTFNRIGKMRLFGNEDMFIYEVTPKGLKPIKTSYDEDYDAYAFETRALTSYALSDRELKFTPDSSSEVIPTPEPETPSVPVPPAVKPNPPTGRGNTNGIMGVLSALAMTATAALTFKKIK